MNYTFVKSVSGVLAANPKLSRFSSPSKTVLTADVYQTGLDDRGSWWLLGYPNLASGKGQLVSRHSGGVDVLFADGHAKTYSLGMSKPTTVYSSSYNVYLKSPFNTYGDSGDLFWHPTK